MNSSDLNYLELIELMIRRCAYAEDLDAVAHFVYHPRHNGSSNVCLACFRGTDEHAWEDEDGERSLDASWLSDDHGHDATCSYLLARRELEPRRGEFARIGD
jgi:hypothetical protein